MQQTLVAGDSLSFTTAVPDYPATGGWALAYRLVPRTSSNPVISLSTSASGANYSVAVAAATTAGWAPDTYAWASWVDKAGEKYTVGSGTIVISPDPRTLAAGADTRTSARKALEDATAAFRTWAATGGVTKTYKIGERERTFNSLAEITKLLNMLQTAVNEEEKLAGRFQSLGRRIQTRI